MKTKLFLLITGFSLSVFVNAQTLFVPNSTNGIGASGNDNVGIGTSTPGEKLEVGGVMRTVNKDSPGATWDNLSFWSDGENSYIYANGDEKGLHIKSNVGGKILLESNVGIGTSSPDAKLEIKGNGIVPSNSQYKGDLIVDGISYSGSNQTPSWLESQNGGFELTSSSYSNGFGWRFITGDLGNGFTPLVLQSRANSSVWLTNLVINNSGSVGIGTTTPDQKLTVKGKIHAEEVIVDLNVPAADYVFAKDYSLMPLHKVEQYVKTNSHLPDVPSATEIKDKGLSVGEMQNKLLQKIEELTLYAIEQNKQISQQNQKLDQQNREMIQMEKRIKELETK
jgi:Uncharacterized archaeal coiled-coil protein